MKFLATPDDLRGEFKRLVRTYSRFEWAVAWASNDFELFGELVKRRHKIGRIVIGTHFHQTHPDFIAEFAGDPNVRFRLGKDGTTGVFHPKLFLFWNKNTSWEALIGSPNFTRSAFSKNVEHALLVGAGDAGAEDLLTQFRDEISRLWTDAVNPSADQLRTYRARWERNRSRIKALEGLDAEEIRKKGIYESDILTFGWDEFLAAVRNGPGQFVPQRLNLLQKAADIFAQAGSFNAMSDLQRRQVSGIAADGAVQWRLFGSMNYAIDFKKRVTDNRPEVSAALDAIPAGRAQAVGRDDYFRYLEILRTAFNYNKPLNGLGVVTRLLCIKRPDYFICLDEANKTKICDRLGVNAKRVNPDTYWDAVIAPLLETRWWQSSRPARGTAAGVWDARVAMIDEIFYEPK